MMIFADIERRQLDGGRMRKSRRLSAFGLTPSAIQFNTRASRFNRYHPWNFGK